MPEKGSQHDFGATPDGKLPSIASVDDLFVVTAGGAGAGWSAYIPVWAPTLHNRSVTVAVEHLGAHAAVDATSLAKLRESLAAGLRSDGADLLVKQVGLQALEFTLVIPTASCAECVMPAATLSAIFATQVEKALGRGWTFVIRDPREG